MHGGNRVLQEDVEQSVGDRIESPGYDPFVKARFLQLLQEATVFVWMCSTPCEEKSRRLGHNKEYETLLVSAEEGVERFLEATAERHDLLIRLNKHKVSKKNMERYYRNKALS